MPPILLLIFFLFMSASEFGFSQSPWFPNYPHLFYGQERFRNGGDRLSKPLIGDGGRIYACSENTLFAFENNGSIAWFLPLTLKCNMAKSPVHGGRGKIYLIAENRVLQINIIKIGTSEPAIQVLFDPGPGERGDEIVGIAVSTLCSSVIINVENRGLFAYLMRGELLWSIGPVMNQYGYRQGCRKNVSDCYFSSAPVIDQCEASIYISNTEGELYSLSIRSPQFKWIQDLSSFDKVYTITPGNNGLLFVTVPVKSLILALDVSSGNVLWQASIGPLSSAESSPVVDSYGWVTIGSLDGFLYSFSPTGTLNEFAKADALDSVIQFSILLDCSGYAVYFCQTEMGGKVIHMNDRFTQVSAMKPKRSVFTLMVPSTGKIYWSESNHGNFVSLLSKSDLQNFVVDEGMLLAFITASKIGNQLSCRSNDLKLASSCSEGTSKHLSVYTGAALRFCCVFWRKKKLQDQDLGLFLEKRRSLQLKRKAIDRTITELEQKATAAGVTKEATMEELGELVQKRQGITRKLSTSYSLGRDETVSNLKSVLPLYSGGTRSCSFQRAKEGSFTIFQTLSNTSSEESSSDNVSDSEVEENPAVKGKAKAAIEVESSSDDEQLERRYQRSPEPVSSSKGYMDSPFVQQETVQENFHGAGMVATSMPSSSRSLRLKRRTFSSLM
ncbi:putative Serine-threonine protein kinase, plant-type [Hibiscus syriacus]|uniref:Serine-threonine protein kinase, plant-type n=1 Tax=Hibiscus syriacus TaxID=106335 RepID=A0A6A2XER4_HIBSY|nr:putative Serine-threonine protein kinase, plant-type [Hibiscus syriacus]